MHRGNSSFEYALRKMQMSWNQWRRHHKKEVLKFTSFKVSMYLFMQFYTQSLRQGILLDPYGTDVTYLWHENISHGDGCHKYVTCNLTYRRRMSHKCDKCDISLRCSLHYFASVLKDYQLLVLYLLLSSSYSSTWQTASFTSYSHINKNGKTFQLHQHGGKCFQSLAACKFIK